MNQGVSFRSSGPISARMSALSSILKRARLARFADHDAYRHHEFDLADTAATLALFERELPERVIHLAAQAGVRYSIDHPHAYGQANLVAFLNVLEGARHHEVTHLTYASSSSVYGGNEKSPFDESDPVDHPVSLYAATKRANELMAHSYSHLFRLPITAVRFFTVYGPWGRPDMALSLFADAILAGRPLRVFNEGKLSRDYTFVADVAEGVARLLDVPPAPEPDRPVSPERSKTAPFRVLNLGNNQPVQLLTLIEKLATAIGKQPQLELLPMQPGDVLHTCADIDSMQQLTGFTPQTPLDDGLRQFVDWYMTHDAQRWK